MKRLEQVIGWLNTLLIVLAGAALLAVMGISVINVIFREARLRFVGAYELVGIAGAIVVAAALGQTQVSKDHVPVDIITRKFSSTINCLIDILKYALKLGFSVTVAVQLVLWGLSIRQAGELSETLRIPYYPFVFCVAAGFAVLACTVLLDLARSVIAACNGMVAAKPDGVSEDREEEEVPLP